MSNRLRIVVMAHCRNEVKLLPFWLRHYATFADGIHIFDDGSDDGSVEIMQAHPACVHHPIKMGGIMEDELLKLAYAQSAVARDYADLVIWADMDEFVYHPQIRECLARHWARGRSAIQTVGFNMMGAPLPQDDGRSQLVDLYRTGVRAPIYSKTIIFDPKYSIVWSRGKHHLVSMRLKVSPIDDGYAANPDRIKLLHYRYLTPEYTAERNARQLSRCPDPGAAWSCKPEHTGEHSPAWVARTTHLARDVVNLDACYLPAPNDA